jgi:hypothetical protein
MSTSKALLLQKLVTYHSGLDPGATAQQKANELATIIDEYITDVVAKMSGTGTCTGATATGPPGGPLPIVSQPVTVTPGSLKVN